MDAFFREKNFHLENFSKEFQTTNVENILKLLTCSKRWNIDGKKHYKSILLLIDIMHENNPFTIAIGYNYNNSFTVARIANGDGCYYGFENVNSEDLCNSIEKVINEVELFKTKDNE